jgi:hypothetical protein
MSEGNREQKVARKLVLCYCSQSVRKNTFVRAHLDRKEPTVVDNLDTLHKTFLLGFVTPIDLQIGDEILALEETGQPILIMRDTYMIWCFANPEPTWLDRGVYYDIIPTSGSGGMRGSGG